MAGNADILLVPDLEAGNMLAKQLIYFADAIAAGLVLGARVPIVLTSRADPLTARIASAGAAGADHQHLGLRERLTTPDANGRIVDRNGDSDAGAGHQSRRYAQRR
jgi:hypothetical protein